MDSVEKNGTRVDESSKVHSTIRKSEPGWKPGTKEWLIVICLTVTCTLVALDATILITVLPSIAKSLSGSATDAFWVGTAYLLSCAVVQPFIVSLSDIFGRRELLFVSVTLFTIGTIVCAISNDFTKMLAGRSIQGIGGGGMTALGNVILVDIIPLSHRPVYQGILQLGWAVGTVAGPLIGGLFVDHTTWRWVFYINFPFCAMGLIMIPLVVRLHVERGSMRERVLQQVDWIGGFLFIASTTSFLIGISWGGSQHPWNSWRTLVPVIAGAFGVILTLFWELYGAKAPFLRLWLFKQRAAIAAYGCAMLQGTLVFSVLYYLPVYLQATKSYSATRTGVGIIPYAGSLFFTSMATSIFIKRSGRYRWAIWAGWTIVIASTALLIILSATTPTYGWVLLFVPVGVGHGFVLISLNFAIQALAQERDGAYASAMYTFLRTFGMCLGVAIGGTVFQNRLAIYLGHAGLDVSVARDAEAFVTIMKSLNPTVFPVHDYRIAYAAALRNIWEVFTAIAAVGGGLSLLISHASMDRALDSEHVLAD